MPHWEDFDAFMEHVEEQIEVDVLADGDLVSSRRPLSAALGKMLRLNLVMLWKIERRLKEIEKLLKP